MSDFHRICRSDRVEEGRLTVGRAGVRQIAVTKVDGQLVAFKNACPHAGAPLSGGHVQGDTVSCSRHGWAFDMRSGACADQPLYSLRLWDVREHEGWVEARPMEEEIW
ncbi:MAG: nitrite reductase/ring-hydroxylating ferredoxin subunit [Bradymonadia bacterium]|jgi:nitrite reductase/ring-hydroxylating ferredoxin subunit